MTKIALIGAGGKMGTRLTDNLKDSFYEMDYVEVSEQGISRLKDRGLSVTSQKEAVPFADVVILAVPDVSIGDVSSTVVPQMKNGAILMLLDPAAAYMGELPERKSISYVVAHPCHPPIFNDEVTVEGRRDYFGGIHARQAIVCALVQGSEEDYKKAENIAKLMYAPVFRSHRLTLKQMATLEPTMAETIGATFAIMLKETMEEAVNNGVPYEAAEDFMLGHINIELAIAFKKADNPFSDAALIAIEYGKKNIIKEGWKDLFKEESITDQIEQMLHSKTAYQTTKDG